MKTVNVIIPVAAAFFAKAAPVAKRLGIDARKHLGQVMAEITLHQLEVDTHLWLTTVVFPDRKTAQRAVNVYFKDASCNLDRRSECVSFVEGGRERFARFYAPGAQRAMKKLQSLSALLIAAEKRASAARSKLSREAGCAVG